MIFEDKRFHFFVLGALYDNGTYTDEDIETILVGQADEDSDEDDDNDDEDRDEDEIIEAGLDKLHGFNIDEDFLKEIESLEMSIDFNLCFEGVIGVETGGEDSYNEIENLKGIELLVNLTDLELEYVNTYSGYRTLDLEALKNHPKIERIVFGNGEMKNIAVIESLPSLEEITIPKKLDRGEQFESDLLDRLKAKDVAVHYDSF